MDHHTTNSTFLGIDCVCDDPRDARFAVVSVPYDATSTFVKGADKGPAAILDASAQVELYDIETGIEPHRAGIVTADTITIDGPPDELAAAVEESIDRIASNDQLPIVLGGEHSVSIGAIRASATRTQPNMLSVLQIDAHADTRESYHGNACNHACVMARAREVAEIVQVGIRSMDASEIDTIDTERIFFAHDIAHAGRDWSWMDKVVNLLTEHVYITIDLDAFDPAILPATGTPEPGGLDWYTVNELLRRVIQSKHIVGFDVVELCPLPNEHASAFLAAKLIHRFCAMIVASGNAPA